MSANIINFVGNLVGEPELRFTTNGTPVANFRLAVNERIRVNNEWRDRPTFVNIVAWNSLAENLAASLQKGDRVMVNGRLQIRSHESRDTGVTNWYTEIIANEVGVALRFHTVSDIESSYTKPDAEQAQTDDTPVAAATAGGDEPF